MPKSSKSPCKVEALRLLDMERRNELLLGGQILGMTEVSVALNNELLPHFRAVMKTGRNFVWLTLADWLDKTFLDRIEKRRLDFSRNRVAKYRDGPLCEYDHQVRRLNKMLMTAVGFEATLDPQFLEVQRVMATMRQRVNSANHLKLAEDIKALTGQEAATVVPLTLIR